MLRKPDACAGCPLYSKPSGKPIGWVPPSGSGRNGVLVVGEMPDRDAEMAGEALVGVAGKQFDRLITRAGYPRQEFRLASALSCRPSDGRLAGEWFENKALAHCAPNLDRAIEQMQPKVIISLGNVAMQRLTGFDGMMRHRGRPLPLKGRDGVWVMPTFHPSFLLPRHGQDDGVRNPARYTGAVILDIKRAFHIRDHGYERVAGHYLLDPSPSEFLGFILEYEAALALNPLETFLSWDIETLWKIKNSDEGELDLKEASEAGDEGKIIRWSFSFRPGYAASVPESAEYRAGIQRLLASASPKVTWNGWHFDEPVVRKEGYRVAGVSHDGMWAWHLYQPDLDKGLEFVSSFASDLLPWKHLSGEDPVLYSAIDPDAAIQNFLYTKRMLERAGQYDLYLRHVVEMEQIWQQAGGAGVHIDIPKQSALRTKLDGLAEELTAQIQPLVPLDVRPRKRYKTKRVVDVGIAEGRTFETVEVTGKIKVCSVCGVAGVTKGDHLKGGKKNPCNVAGASIETHLGHVVEWDEVLPFNPNSGPQLRAYIHHFHHPMGKDPKDRTREVADAKHLKKLIAQYGDAHPAYATILEFHRISKTRSTYLPMPDALGRIYTTYTNAPATWRTSSKAPSEHGANLQNWGKREDNKWAKLARETVIAKPGHVFVSADSKAVEALMTGWFMGDLKFMKLSAKGVYSWLQCVAHGVEFTEANAARLKKSDDKGYRKKKQTTLGILYGMDANVLYETYSDDFDGVADAKKEREFVLAALPALKDWQTETRVRAHKETFLETPWGYRRYFYDIYVWKRDKYGLWKRAEGQGADKAVAFKPQNANTAFQRDNLLIIKKEEPWMMDYLPANLFVHDSLTFEPPEERMLEVAAVLERVMTRPIAEMNGLQVGIEIEVGRNWGDASEANPEGMNLLRAVMIEPTEAMLPNYREEKAA